MRRAVLPVTLLLLLAILLSSPSAACPTYNGSFLLGVQDIKVVVGSSAAARMPGAVAATANANAAWNSAECRDDNGLEHFPEFFISGSGEDMTVVIRTAENAGLSGTDPQTCAAWVPSINSIVLYDKTIDSNGDIWPVPLARSSQQRGCNRA